MIYYPWRALAVAPRAEIIAAEGCSKIGLTTCCPQYKLITVSRGHRHERMIPFLASYIFVRFAYDDAVLWHRVMDCKGVNRILLGQVTDDEIARMRQQCGDGTGELSYEVRNVFRGIKVNDKITLSNGVFKGFSGTIEEIYDEEGIAQIKTTLLGREIEVNQPLAWCDPSPEVMAGRSNQLKHRRRKHRSTRKLAGTVELRA